MKLIHLYTKKRGVRFYSGIHSLLKEHFEEDKYNIFYKREEFFKELDSNMSEYDIVLITAHGAEDSIIIPRKTNDMAGHSSEYERYITIDDVNKFDNDFVFAVACCTANKFGPKAIEKGALSYLGYEVLIEQLFKVTDICISNKVRIVYESILKHIFVEELSKAVIEFIYEFQTVKMLKQNFSFKLEKRINNMFDMTTQELYENYKYRIDKEKWEKDKPNLRIWQLGVLNIINNHFVILGDPNYISMLGMENRKNISAGAKNRILNARFQDEKYQQSFIERANSFFNSLDN